MRSETEERNGVGERRRNEYREERGIESGFGKSGPSGSFSRNINSLWPAGLLRKSKSSKMRQNKRPFVPPKQSSP